MSSAAHALHDQLHIHFIYGAGADINLALVIRQYKAGLDPPDIQQFIGSLGAYMVGLGRSSAVQIEMAKYCL